MDAATGYFLRWSSRCGVAATKSNFILMNQMVGTGVSRADPCLLLPKPNVRAWSHTLYLWLLTHGQYASRAGCFR